MQKKEKSPDFSTADSPALHLYYPDILDRKPSHVVDTRIR